MYRIIIQIIIAGSQILARGFTKAIQQELRTTASAPRDPAKPPPIIANSAMSIDEAMKILNVDRLDKQLIESNYKYLFDINDRKNGGSLYLQSKVYRAKERLDQELK